MNKAKLNFWVDVAIGLAGAVSAISGLLLLLPADQNAGIVGVSLRTWSTLHTWGSLAAMAGVGLHLVLHWSWMLAMAKQMLLPTRQRQAPERVTPRLRAPPSAGGPFWPLAGLWRLPPGWRLPVTKR